MHTHIMSNENAILNHLFRHNLWANSEMLAACANLTSEQLATELSGTYGRLDHTLIHLARAQGGYLRRLTSWQPAPNQKLEYEEPFPGVEAIGNHLRFTGERLIDAAAEASADWQLEFEYEGPELEYKGQVERLPAWVVLLQAAYHATEHRQQIATILTTLGVEPPEPDLWAFWDTMAPSAER
jgi:uncharacterized damage-inducible protein DinB